jgi:cell division protein FtsB
MTDTLTPLEAPKRSRRVKLKRSRLGTGMFIVLLVALGLVATGVLPLRDFLERENAVDAANAQLTAINAENAQLAEDISALYSEEEVERIAREQYGFVMPGEVGYVAVLPDAAEPTNAPATPVVPVRDDRSLLVMIWDFITGNDLAVDE